MLAYVVDPTCSQTNPQLATWRSCTCRLDRPTQSLACVSILYQPPHWDSLTFRANIIRIRQQNRCNQLARGLWGTPLAFNHVQLVPHMHFVGHWLVLRGMISLSTALLCELLADSPVKTACMHPHSTVTCAGQAAELLCCCGNTCNCMAVNSQPESLSLSLRQPCLALAY
jgi:hypothetical protein